MVPAFYRHQVSGIRYQGWSRDQVGRYQLLGLTYMQVAGCQRHRTKRRRTEALGVDADGAVKLIGGGASGCETADRATQRWHVGEADREIERHDALLSCIQRQTEREITGRRVIAFQHEVGVDGAQREAEWIRIADLKPDANTSATEWRPRARTTQTQFGGLAGRLFETWRSNDLLQVGETSAGSGCRDDGNQSSKRNSSTGVSRHGVLREASDMPEGPAEAGPHRRSPPAPVALQFRADDPCWLQSPSSFRRRSSVGS